ncbi:hypothetical protein SLS59_001710 [Nothophoma quercina]|uniref:Homeodomain transcription factor HD2 n=1 Tax=Nothophoma quercina TaxID=749835 RepID=A0ABR3RY42_9PLEO
MQLAEILSDLVSLRPGVCDPAAALALVSARPSASAASSSLTTNTAESTNPSTSSDEQDVDLQRAKQLVTLHYEVRERFKRGELSRGLAEARRDVERALGG